VKSEWTVFHLFPVQPFKLDLTVWALRRRKENFYDIWNNGVYKRILVIHGKPVLIKIKQLAPASCPKLEVTLKGCKSNDYTTALQIIEQTLGVKRNLTAFYNQISKDEKLGSLFNSLTGLKPPRFPSLFEAIVNGICCQQLSLTVGIILLSRLSQKYGQGIENEAQKSFPEPDRLAKSNIQELRQLGLSSQKARAIIALSEQFLSNPVGFEDLEKLDNQAVVERLMRYLGVGRWTAEYVLLRGLGRLDSFPGDDKGAGKSLKERLGITRSLSYHEIKSIVSRWHPFEGFVYFHFVVQKLKEQGLV
jgi:DNA-3-methyladenine glycosylase II